MLEKQLATSRTSAAGNKAAIISASNSSTSLHSAHPSTDNLASQAGGSRDTTAAGGGRGLTDLQQESAAVGLLKTHVTAWRRMACRRLLAPGALLPIPLVETDSREVLKREATISVAKKGIFDVYW